MTTKSNEPILNDTNRLDWILSNCEIRNKFINLPSRTYKRDEIDCLLMAEHLFEMKKKEQKEQKKLKNVLDRAAKDV